MQGRLYLKIAHKGNRGAAEHMMNAEALLAVPPQIEKVEVLASKLPR